MSKLFNEKEKSYNQKMAAQAERIKMLEQQLTVALTFNGKGKKVGESNKENPTSPPPRTSNVADPARPVSEATAPAGGKKRLHDERMGVENS